MSYFTDNSEALAIKHPGLAAKLRAGAPEALDIIESRSGLPTARYNNRYIHSRIDPVSEARRFVEGQCGEQTSVGLFYGFGLGYHVEAFLQMHPAAPAVVIEPDRTFFAGALSARALQSLLCSPNLLLFVDAEPESLMPVFDDLPFSHYKVIKLRSVYDKNRDYYEKMDRVIGAYQSRKSINLNTLKRFGRRWVRNLFTNVPLIAHAPGVETLEELCTGLPALVLASGPALDDLLPFLPELSERFVLIAVDTSLKACLQRGIEPDLMVTVDPQYWNTRHLDWAWPRTPLLVSESSAHPRIFRCLDLPVFLGSSLFPLGRYFESLVGEKGKLGAGGSVATTAWDLARLLGADPIVMAGLDLGFPGGRTHFKGAFFEERFHADSNRMLPAEQSSFSYINQARPFPVASNGAHPVLTDQRMIVYKWWFENQLKIYPDCQTLNLAAAGVKIDGMPTVNVEALSRYPCIRSDINERLAKVRQSAFRTADYAGGGASERGSSVPQRAPDGSKTVETTDRRKHDSPVQHADVENRLIEALRNLGDDLARLEQLAHQGVEEIERLGSRSSSSRDDLRKIDAIDSHILSSGSRQVAAFLLQPLIHKIMAESPNRNGADTDGVLGLSKTLYTELEESALFHRKLLDRSIERLAGSRSQGRGRQQPG